MISRMIDWLTDVLIKRRRRRLDAIFAGYGAEASRRGE